MSQMEAPGGKGIGTIPSQNMGVNSNVSNRKRSKKSNKKEAKVDTFDTPVFSVRYKDHSIELSEDRLVATGYKGWATVLVSHGTSRGTWYFEIKVLEPTVVPPFSGYSKYFKMNQKPNIRIGWSCRYCRYDIPVGSKAYSYSLCTRSLSIFNRGERKSKLVNKEICEHEIASDLADNKDDKSNVCNTMNMQNTSLHKQKDNGSEQADTLYIKPGDVVGCLINLSGLSYNLDDPTKIPHLYSYLELGMLCDPEKPPEEVIDSESWIKFYLNGKPLNILYKGLASGFYHPAISLYMGSVVQLNTGPNFWYPIKEEHKATLYLERPEIK